MDDDRGNVIKLSDYRCDPHICLQVYDGSAHVVSCNDIESFIRGELEIEDLKTLKVETSTSDGVESDDWKGIIRRIVGEWYESVICGG